MAVAGSYSHYGLRESHQHQQQDSNLIETGCGEKTLGIGGTKTTDKLTLASFSVRFAIGGWWRRAVIPLVD